MNQDTLNTIKSKSMLLLLISGFVGYLCIQLVIKYQFLALLIAILSVVGLLFLLRQQRAINKLPKTQLYFMFLPFIFLYVTEIPKIGPLPLSPIFFFVGLYVLYGLLNPKIALGAFNDLSGKVFWLMVLCWSYQHFIYTITGGQLLNMQLVELIGIFLGINYFVKKSAARAIWATRILAGVLVISMAWYIGEVASEGPYLIRYGIYASCLNRLSLDMVTENLMVPTGLASYLFLFGYQVAVSLPLSMMLFTIEKQPGWKIFWAIGSILSFLSMIFAGERSVFLAASIALLIFIYKKKQFKATVLVLSVAIFSILISPQFNIDENTIAELHDEKRQVKNLHRLKLQFIGLEIGMLNPLGLRTMDKDWFEEAGLSGADFREGDRISVHNGYLGRFTEYGWLMGFLIAIVVLKLLKAIKLVLSFDKHRLEDVQYAQITALSLLAVLIQALFHNASIFSFNGVSLTIMFLSLAWFDLLKGRVAKTLASTK